LQEAGFSVRIFVFQLAPAQRGKAQDQQRV
jgi:hypothetical protein